MLERPLTTGSPRKRKLPNSYEVRPTKLRYFSAQDYHRKQIHLWLSSLEHNENKFGTEIRDFDNEIPGVISSNGRKRKDIVPVQMMCADEKNIVSGFERNTGDPPRKRLHKSRLFKNFGTR